jgi:hypothetical protein
MTRDIKFRAWDESRKEWSQQSFAIDQQGDIHMWREIGNGPTYAYGRSDLKPIICQYTGLKDKNGTECYEDDLIKIDGAVYHVVWQGVPNGAGFYLGIYKGSAVTSLQMYRVPDGVIVGNVYENPDLLAAPAEEAMQ